MIDLTADTPINTVACAYRDFRAGILTKDGATLILTSTLRLPATQAVALLEATPGARQIALSLCTRDGWDHHDQTDDYPCTQCQADAQILTEAASA